MQDLGDLEDLLEAFPMAGFELARKGSEALRRMRTRRAPFFVWYVHDDGATGDGPITFLHLFHTRQRTPEPRSP
jgi:hypothetical protein